MQTALEQLQEQVRRVAELRRQEAMLGDALQEKRLAFEATIVSELSAKRGCTAMLEQAEAALKALTLAHYEQTGEKKPVVGVQVKEITALDYDKAVAFEWAKERKMAVVPESLDVKAFEKIAKATPLDFVTEIVTPRAEIASKLEVEAVV